MIQFPHLFADRIINVAVTGNLIRLELGALHAPIEEGQKPQLISSQTVVIPLEGFVPSFNMLESIMKKLVADGVLKRQAQAAVAQDSSVVEPKQ